MEQREDRAEGIERDRASRLAAPESDRWHTRTGKRVNVHVRPGSAALSRAEGEQRSAEEIIEALVDLLEPPAPLREQDVDLYLIDGEPVPAGSSSSTPPPPSTTPDGLDLDPTEALLRVVPGSGEPEPLALPLARFLVARWYGGPAAVDGVIAAGIGGFAAAKTETGPSLESQQQLLRAELAGKRPVSIFERAGSTGSAEIRQAAATSFVAFLIDCYGEAALREYLGASDPERHDRAAILAYHEPLGALEEAWIAELRRTSTSTGAFRAFLQRVGPLLRPYRKRELEMLLYMLIGLSYTLAFPLTIKYTIDHVITEGARSRLLAFILVLFGLYVVDALVGLRRTYVSTWISQRVALDIEERMFAHLERLPHSFYARAKVGDLMSRLSNDLNVVGQGIAMVVDTGIYMVLSALVAAATALLLSPLLGAIVILVAPCFALGYLLLRTRLRAASLKMQQIVGEVSTYEQESLSAYAVIKAFGLEEQSVQNYHARLMTAFGGLLRLTMLSSLFSTSISLATTLGELVVLGAGGYLVIEGRVTLGTLVAFFGLLGSLFQPIATLSGLGQTLQKASGSLERINELLDEPVVIEDRPDAVPLPPLSNEIQLEHVSFGYDDGQTILHDLDLVIPAGSRVALVGPSGSGKSTVVNLLLRFWDPQTGRVTFDGHDLRDVTLASLRGQIGLVFQDTFIFDSTVRDNIAIGRPEASDAEVIAAAKAADLSEFVESLPAGFDTVLGERGVRMSGGQRQRLAIARALIRNPRIMILDEATSALDAETEADIERTLRAAARGRTTISITHRLTSVVDADRIFVLEHGRLVEQGTHDELLAADGLYARLYQQQTHQAEADALPDTLDPARLRALPVLSGMPDDVLAAVARRMQPREVAPGVELVRQGEPPSTLYLLDDGAVEVIVSHQAGEQRILSLPSGASFGESTLTGEEPSPVTVRTVMPSRLFALERQEVRQILDQLVPQAAPAD